jgi:hypothetical protein
MKIKKIKSQLDVYYLFIDIFQFMYPDRNKMHFLSPGTSKNQLFFQFRMFEKKQFAKESVDNGKFHTIRR